MKRSEMLSGALCALLTALAACEPLDDALPQTREEPADSEPLITLSEVAQALSWVDIRPAQMSEVRGAVDMSAGNGYDEEYLMQSLFASPGVGVGGGDPTKADLTGTPLRDLLREAVRARLSTRGEAMDADTWLDALSSSDIQIYWPYSSSWDGMTTPVITFDPGDRAEQNLGYLRRVDGEVETVLVTEDLARERPVWVVNRNDDAEYRTLELLRREDPSWGEGGGDILVRPSTASSTDLRTLVLRSFQANRQYDSWFAGASEFFVKVGAVEDFTASTEAELRLYEPSITDFMIVVRRGQVGEPQPFNAVLVSEWTGQLSNCAFMIIEDDGGTQTSWKCSAVVKYNSKSYGFELEIPLRTRDDIVWRGALSRSYIEKYSGITGHFGDVDLVLELI